MNGECDPGPAIVGPPCARGDGVRVLDSDGDLAVDVDIDILATRDEGELDVGQQTTWKAPKRDLTGWSVPAKAMSVPLGQKRLSLPKNGQYWVTFAWKTFRLLIFAPLYSQFQGTKALNVYMLVRLFSSTG